MKEQYKLIIPEPCNEDWDKMTETEKGRFCAVCSKNLIDFTDKSRFEIEEILSNPQEKICGRFNTEQLDTVHIEIPEYTFRKQYSFARIFAIALLLAMGTTLLSCNSEGKTKKIETVTVVENSNKKINNDDDNDGIANEFDVDYVTSDEKNDSLLKRNDSLLKKRMELLKQDSIERENRLKRYKSSKNKNPSTIPRHISGKPVRVPFHSPKIPKAPLSESLKQNITLVALGRKPPTEITKYFCTSDPKIVVNNSVMTFSKFYKKIKGKKIKIKKLSILKNDEDYIKTIHLKYRVQFNLNPLFRDKDNNNTKDSIINKKLILKKKDTIIKQVNSSKVISPKAKDSIKEN